MQSDTNLALFGSEVEKNLKFHNAQSEPAWKQAGEKEGVQVWRIEKFQVKTWPTEQYGKFYDGDSYIVLRSYKKSADARSLSHDIHFWLGRETTQDEAGTAAYKTVELDDYFGGEPVQYREVQGCESLKFLSLFKQVEILHGGIESGFKHVQTHETTAVRLFHVKGAKKYLRVLEVQVAASALNAGDCFVLVEPKKIRVWQGNQCSGIERNKAVAYAQELASAAKTQVQIIAQSDDEATQFYESLGGLEGTIAAATADAPNVLPKSVHRLSDESGKLTFSLLGSTKVTRGDFESKDVFVFDTGVQVFVWIGKETSEEERRSWMHYAAQYLQKVGRNATTPIVKIAEGNESSDFIEALDR